MMKKGVLVFILTIVTLISGCQVIDTTGQSGASQSTQSTQSTQSSQSASSSGNNSSSGNAGGNAGGNSSSSNGSSGNGSGSANGNVAHVDEDDNGYCDDCSQSVTATFDFFAVNDLHGKFADSETQDGVDELSTYIKNARKANANTVLLSSGDMWQGSSESNLTKGAIITEWMNDLEFDSMTLGNHEYDWGETYIEDNLELAEFPFLAINVYNRTTNKIAEYCKPSVMVERNGVKIGIIGAIGDCYSSISSDKVEDIYFKTGSQLSSLVKVESDKLRSQGADFIVYSLHDGYGSSFNSTSSITNSNLSSYYDAVLSDGYVDLIFEAHTHQHYVLHDSKGIYHLQGGGDNDGITHAEVEINYVNDTFVVNEAEFITTSEYSSLADDPIVSTLMKKYEDQISIADEVLGTNARYRSSTVLRNLMADLYYEIGIEKWGAQYNIVLGGGFISVRSPYVLQAGEVTYGDVQSIFPFDNQIVLCTISGSKLKSQFFETTNENYFISYGAYGTQVKENIDTSATYYVVTDTYSSQYTYNGLTEVARYDETTFARDLLADYIREGGLED